MKYFHFIPAACIFLFCQCGGQDSHFLSDTKYIPVFSEDSCQYIDHGDNLHFTGAYSDASLFYDNMALICNQSDKNGDISTIPVNFNIRRYIPGQLSSTKPGLGSTTRRSPLRHRYERETATNSHPCFEGHDFL